MKRMWRRMPLYVRPFLYFAYRYFLRFGFLDGKQEVPANTSAGKGTAEVDYDASSKKLSWKLNYSGLSGPATAKGWPPCPSLPCQWSSTPMSWPPTGAARRAGLSGAG